jgi:hypothetical protein
MTAGAVGGAAKEVDAAVTDRLYMEMTTIHALLPSRAPRIRPGRASGFPHPAIANFCRRRDSNPHTLADTRF